MVELIGLRRRRKRSDSDGSLLETDKAVNHVAACLALLLGYYAKHCGKFNFAVALRAIPGDESPPSRNDAGAGRWSYDKQWLMEQVVALEEKRYAQPHQPPPLPPPQQPPAASRRGCGGGNGHGAGGGIGRRLERCACDR